MLSYEDMIAQVAEHIARHDSHGYSQPNRAGDGTVESITLSDGTVVRIHGGDYDCSEMARTCVAAAGLIPWGYWDSYMWTGNEDEVLTSHGFVRMSYSASKVRRGDVLLVKGHTGIALGNGLQADAHGDEYGGINGPNKGDQTGREIEVRSLRSWTYIYRYAGPARPQAGGIMIDAHIQTYGWTGFKPCTEVVGTTGQAKRLEGLRFQVPDGMVLGLGLHVQRVGDVYYDMVRSGEESFVFGSEGIAFRLESIKFDVKQLPAEYAGKRLQYRVHQQTYGWTDWVDAGQWAGRKGESKRLEAIQLRWV